MKAHVQLRILCCIMCTCNASEHANLNTIFIKQALAQDTTHTEKVGDTQTTISSEHTGNDGRRTDHEHAHAKKHRATHTNSRTH